MNIPPLRTYPLRWVALAAALAGVAVTLALRLDPMQNPDSIAFVALARSFLAGTGLRYREALIPGLDLVAFRAPGYPLFLALGLALGGVGTVVALQGAMNGLSAALVGAIAQRLGGGARAAWIAFAIRLAWPTAWFHSGLLLSEVFYEFLTVLAAWLVLESIEHRRVRWSVVAAAATALAVLCRPVGLGLAMGLGIWLLLKFPRAAVAYGLATFLLWAPWPVRNYLVLHAVVPFTTNGGATAWAGTTDGDVRPAYDWMGANVQLGEVGFDAHFRELTRQNLRRDPKAAVKAVLTRALIYVGPIRGRAPELWVHRFAMLGALAALALGLLRGGLALPAMIWAAQGAIMLPIFLIDRYRFPTEWCVVVAAALGIGALSDRIGARRTALAAAVALALCLAGSLVLAHGMKTG
jgi:hypothetical protein